MRCPARRLCRRRRGTGRSFRRRVFAPLREMAVAWDAVRFCKRRSVFPWRSGRDRRWLWDRLCGRSRRPEI